VEKTAQYFLPYVINVFRLRGGWGWRAIEGRMRLEGYWGEDEVGGLFSCMREEMCTKFWYESLKKQDCLEDTSADQTLMLSWPRSGVTYINGCRVLGLDIAFISYTLRTVCNWQFTVRLYQFTITVYSAVAISHTHTHLVFLACCPTSYQWRCSPNYPHSIATAAFHSWLRAVFFI
jgi:hypothetical protein